MFSALLWVPVGPGPVPVMTCSCYGPDPIFGPDLTWAYFLLQALLPGTVTCYDLFEACYC
jgi:hypothetical protein